VIHQIGVLLGLVVLFHFVHVVDEACGLWLQAVQAVQAVQAIEVKIKRQENIAIIFQKSRGFDHLGDGDLVG
jgi:hypothetical protein